MSTRERIALMRAEAWTPERNVLCPDCLASTLLRSDSGLCERCHAKRPDTRRQWESDRASALQKAKIQGARVLPPGICFICRESYGGMTADQHDQLCSARPHRCDCGRRWWTRTDLAAHRRTCGLGRP